MQAVFQHLTAADYVISQWSGGSTTQIAIGPKGAIYADRDFVWRVSSASVELEQSDFTPLPDYHRYISLLGGEMILTHGTNAPIKLQPFEIHSFDGGIKTISQGRCVDFNLMLRKGHCTGKLSALHLSGKENQTELARFESTQHTQPDVLVVYCAAGSSNIWLEEQSALLSAGEAALIEHPGQSALHLSGVTPASFLVAQIKLI